jgi:hypothetical protein
MQNEKIKGSCLCGEVTYQFSGPVKVFQYCHCTRCQKITGSAHASNIIIDPDNFEWLTGEKLVGRFELAEAKHFASSFCTTCGSSLPWITQSAKAMIVPAGTLDDDPKVKPMHNIFYADKACWYDNVDDLVKYDELPTKK